MGMETATARRGWNGWLYRCSSGAWTNSLPCLDFAITRDAGSADVSSEENAMKRAKEKPIPLEIMLGVLAMRFRGTRDEGERDAITREYAAVVTQLIESGKWKAMPTFENQLPDERLPKAFFDYWAIPCPQEQNGSARQPKPG
jgi:hypothetical protein